LTPTFAQFGDDQSGLGREVAGSVVIDNDASGRRTMGLADRLKGLAKKAEDATVEHKDQIHQAVQKAEATAEERTGGKYHEQIRKVGAKADTFLEGLKETEKSQRTETTTDGEGTPKAS
jgi:ABC-type transporter Mla subunit MlaD